MPKPANGKYFTKDELLAMVGKTSCADTPAEWTATINMMHDIIEHAPIDSLVLLFANRIAAFDGANASCEYVHALVRHLRSLDTAGRIVATEHSIKHIDDIKASLDNGDIKIININDLFNGLL